MKKFYDGFYNVIMIFCKLLLVAEIIVTSIVVVGRHIVKTTPTWSEETILTCMIYMAMLSAAMGLRRNAHIRMTAFDKVLPPVIVKLLDLFGDIAVMAFAIIMMCFGWKLAMDMGAKGYLASMPFLSKFWLYFPVPFAGAVTILFEIEQIVNHLNAFRKEEKL